MAKATKMRPSRSRAKGNRREAATRSSSRKSAASAEDTAAESLPKRVWRRVPGFCKGLSEFAKGVFPVAALVILLMLGWRLMGNTIAIDPISVPKDLADRGYTPVIAANRLRDKLLEFEKDARKAFSDSRKAALIGSRQGTSARPVSDIELPADPAYELDGDRPAIEVPSTGLSLNTVVDLIRQWFGWEQHRISGDVQLQDDVLQLRLRFDGHQVYASDRGVAKNSPDEMFTQARIEFLKATRPHIVLLAESDLLIVLETADQAIARALDPENPDQMPIELVSKVFAALRYRLNQLAETDTQEVLDRAEKIFARLPEGDENVVWWNTFKGNIYRGQKRYSESIRALNKALEQAPVAPTLSFLSFTQRGKTYLEVGKFDLAVSDLTEAIHLDPNSALAYNNRGVALAQGASMQEAPRATETLSRAIADFTEAIRLDPQHLLAYTNRGRAYFAKGEYARAASDQSEAIQLDPKYTGAYVKRGEALLATRQFGLAMADFNAAIDLNRTTDNANRDPDANAFRGYARFIESDFSAAASDLMESVKIQTRGYPTVWLYLAQMRSGNANATTELAINRHKLSSLGQTKWPYPVVEFFADHAFTPEALLAAAGTDNERCEAHFYIGERYLLQSTPSEASRWLKAAETSCPRGYIESAGAEAELKRLADEEALRPTSAPATD